MKAHKNTTPVNPIVTTPAKKGAVVTTPKTAPAAKTPKTITPVSTLDKNKIIRANKIGKAAEYSPAAKIQVLVTENPHRAGTGRALAFATAISAKTVAAYLAKHSKKAKYLTRWEAMGLLAIQ